MADEFADGIWYFELAAVSDAAAVPDAMAAVLGITQQPGKTMTESIAAALEGRVRLLVIDNCEHVLDATGDLVEAILAPSETARILATSREALALADEQVWPVRSLDIDAAAELFIERARQVAPHAMLDDTDVVAEICQRLDGIPLAIELAASRMSSMAVDELRDHLDHRFRLLVGSRRALGRHQTLRHAVAWSYDALDDAEKQLLERCSVFAGGFDLAGACAVAEAEADRYVVVDLLDALVRKSLVVAEQTSGRTRFSMLETIREFAEEQLTDHGMAAEARDAHARHFAGREADIMAMWNSPRQHQAYVWYMTELANLRSAFRWAADHGDLDVAATIATYAGGILAYALESQESIAWAEELIDAARTAAHPRLLSLYVVAALCWMSGRLEDALAYTEAGTAAMRSERGHVPFDFDGLFGGLYVSIGQVHRGIAWYDTYLESNRDPLGIVRANRVLALVMGGRLDDAVAVAPGIVDVAETTGNPYALSFALLAYGFAFREADPQAALAAMRRGLVIAHESGARSNEAYLANNIGRLEARRGDMAAALDHLSAGIRINHASGSVVALQFPLAILANILDGLEWHEQAAVLSGFAASELTSAVFAEFPGVVAHLREVLGRDKFEMYARQGANMTTAAIAAYAYDQIEQARAKLEQLR